MAHASELGPSETYQRPRVHRPLSSHFARNLGLTSDMIQELAELPGTKNMDDLRDRAQALSQWKASMQRGYLPEPGTVEWPVEPFQSSFVNALDNLAMPRFTRRYPKLLDSLLRQMMRLVRVSFLAVTLMGLFADMTPVQQTILVLCASLLPTGTTMRGPCLS